MVKCYLCWVLVDLLIDSVSIWVVVLFLLLMLLGVYDVYSGVFGNGWNGMFYGEW